MTLNLSTSCIKNSKISRPDYCTCRTSDCFILLVVLCGTVKKAHTMSDAAVLTKAL